MIGSHASARFQLAGGGVEVGHLHLGGNGLHFIVVITQLLQITERDIFQRVAVRADFGINLKAALQLLAIESAKGAVAGQMEILLGVKVVNLLHRRSRRLGHEAIGSEAKGPQQRRRKEGACEDGYNANHVFVPRWSYSAASAALSSAPSTASVIEKGRAAGVSNDETSGRTTRKWRK